MKSLCIMYVAGTHGRIEEYFRSLEMKLQTVVGHHIGAGN